MAFYNFLKYSSVSFGFNWIMYSIPYLIKLMNLAMAFILGCDLNSRMESSHCPSGTPCPRLDVKPLCVLCEATVHERRSVTASLYVICAWCICGLFNKFHFSLSDLLNFGPLQNNVEQRVALLIKKDFEQVGIPDITCLLVQLFDLQCM